MSTAVEQIVTPYHQTNRFSLYEGDCRIVLPTFADCSVDSIVCDPPYELGFMGKGWDRSGIAYDVNVWRECLRALKPGGHLLAFGGSRTYHRLACAIEDAGFEIRDDIDFWYDANPIFAEFYESLNDEQKAQLHQSAGASHLSWIYGSGFPKSLDVSKAIDAAAGAEREKVPATGSLHKHRNLNDDGWAKIGLSRPLMDSPAAVTGAAKQWDGWGTALKPAHEPIVLARKPLIGTVAENVLKHGTGGLNIDGCRVETEHLSVRLSVGKNIYGGNAFHESKTCQSTSRDGDPAGRWPANVILSYPEDEYVLKSNVTPEQKKELFKWLYENA